MPTYEILGEEIWIPGPEDLINYITTPVENYISQALSNLTSYISQALSPISQELQGLTQNFLTGLEGLTNSFLTGFQQMTSGMNMLQQAFLSGIQSVASGIQSGMAQFAAGMQAGFQTIASQIGTSFEELGKSIENLGAQFEQAFIKTWDAVIAKMRQIDFINSVKGILDELRKFILEVLMPTEARSPEEAKDLAEKLVVWGNALFLALAAIQIAAEAASGGQLDYSLGSIYSVPVVQAYQNAIEDLTSTALKASLLEPLEYAINKLTKHKIPSPSDLISFVVKECFPLENLPKAPKQFAKYMEYHGYNELWARAYWEAHWRLPAIEHLREAFYRGIITEEEFKKFLVWHDYKPTPRPGISKSDVDIEFELMYRVPTRTEGRMMWDMGLLTDEDVDEIVKYEGIHPKWREKFKRFIKEFMIRDELRAIEREARHLFAKGVISEAEYEAALEKARIPREFWDVYKQLASIEAKKYVKESKEQHREATLSQVIQAYLYDIIDESELKERLLEMGYAEDDANLLVAVAKRRKYDSLIERYIRRLETLVRNGIITLDDYENELRSMGVPEEEIKVRKAILQVEMQPRRRYLTPTQVARAFWRGLMTAEQAVNYLRQLGYTDEDIQVLIMLYKPRTLAEQASEV